MKLIVRLFITVAILVIMTGCKSKIVEEIDNEEIDNKVTILKDFTTFFNASVAQSSFKNILDDFDSYETKLEDLAMDQEFSNFSKGSEKTEIVLNTMLADTVSTLIFSYEELQGILNIKNPIMTAYEIGPTTFGVIVRDGEQLTCSTYNYESSFPFEKEKMIFSKLSDKKLPDEIKKVSRNINTLAFCIEAEGENQLILTDRELNFVEGILLPEAFEMDQVDFYSKPYVTSASDMKLEAIISGTLNGADTLVAIPLAYRNSTLNHIVMLNLRYSFENGKSLFVGWLTNEYDGIIYYANSAGERHEIYRTSNGGAVNKEFSKEYRIADVIPYPTRYLNRYLFFDVNSDIVFTDEIIPATDMEGDAAQDIFGDMVRTMEDGEINYLNKDLKFVIADGQGTIKKVIQLDEEAINVLTQNEANSNLEWTSTKEGFIVRIKNKLNYYRKSDGEMISINTPPNVYVNFNDSIGYNIGEATYLFDEKKMAFSIKYECAPQQTEQLGQFKLGDILYLATQEGWEGNEISFSEEHENVKMNTEAPPIYDQNKQLIIVSSKQNNQDDILLTNEHMLYIYQDHKARLITDKKVRDYEVNEKGVLYTGYLEEAYAYYYVFETDKTYKLKSDNYAEDLALSDQYAFVLSNHSLINKYDIETLSTKLEVTSIGLTNLQAVEGAVELQSYSIYANNQYLCAEVSDGYKNILYQQEDMTLYDVVDGAYEISNDDYLITSIFDYYVKYDFASKKQIPFAKSGVGFVEYLEGNWMICGEAYEGPKTFSMVEVTDINLLDQKNEHNTYDYAVVKSHFHAICYAIYDYQEERMYFIPWGYKDFEIDFTKNRLEYVPYDAEISKYFQFREKSRILELEGFRL